MVNNIKELVELIARRDGISMNEAWSIVEETQNEILALISHNCQSIDIEETIAYNLGLEPDYFEILVQNI